MKISVYFSTSICLWIGDLGITQSRLVILGLQLLNFLTPMYSFFGLSNCSNIPTSKLHQTRENLMKPQTLLLYRWYLLSIYSPRCFWTFQPIFGLALQSILNFQWLDRRCINKRYMLREFMRTFLNSHIHLENPLPTLAHDFWARTKGKKE